MKSLALLISLGFVAVYAQEDPAKCVEGCQEEMKKAIMTETGIEDASSPMFLFGDYTVEKAEKICTLYDAQKTDGCLSKCQGFTPKMTAAFEYVCVSGKAALTAHADCLAKVGQSKDGELCAAGCLGPELLASAASGKEIEIPGGEGPENLDGMLKFMGKMCKSLNCVGECAIKIIKDVCEAEKQEGASTIVKDYMTASVGSALAPLYQLGAIAKDIVPADCRQLKGETMVLPNGVAPLQMQVLLKKMQVLTKEDKKLDLEITAIQLKTKLLNKQLAASLKKK